MKRLISFLVCTIAVSLLLYETISAQTRVANLRCEYLINPIGLDTPSPRFTWEIESDKGFVQKAWQINVASTPELLSQGKADVWRSEKIESSENLTACSGCKVLEAHKQYFWNVQIWSNTGKVRDAHIPVASFEMAKINEREWVADWISDNFDREFRKAPMFRKSFSLGKSVRQARAYVCGIGYYELYINGNKVGDHYLDNKLMSKFSSLLGKDSRPYEQKAEELRTLINRTWYNKGTALYATGTQAGQAISQALEIAEPSEEQKIADRLVQMIRKNNYSLDFGMLGSKLVPAMLTKYGYVKDAYRMITKKEAPSWANWIEIGLTSLPETWVLDKDFKDASLNHVFLGDVTAWMTNTIAGINYDEQRPAFKHIILHPYFIKDINWAKGEYHSVNGLIRSEWKREAGKVRLSATIHANTTATLYVDRKKVELKSETYTFAIADK